MKYLLLRLGNRSPEGRRRSRREGGSTLWSFHGVVEIVVGGEMRRMTICSALGFFSEKFRAKVTEICPGLTPHRV